MDCQTLADNLTDFLEGNLLESDEIAALEHLSSCNACEVVLAETRSVLQLAHDHGRVPLSDEDRSQMLEGVMSKIEDETT